MSDQATSPETTTPTAPAEQAAPPAPEPQPQPEAAAPAPAPAAQAGPGAQPQPQLTPKQQALKAFNEGFRAKFLAAREAQKQEGVPAAAPAAEARVDARGNLHDPATGQFQGRAGVQPEAAATQQQETQPTTDAAAPEAPATEPPAGEAPRAEAAQDGSAATDAVPEGFVRIEIPEGHPLRERGREHALVPADDEDYHRWAVNNAVRREQVEKAVRYADEVRATAEARIRELNDRVIELQATVEALTEGQTTLISDPEMARLIAELPSLKEESPVLAQLIAAGIQAQIREKAGAKASERRTALEQEQARTEKETRARTLIQQALEQARVRWPEWGEEEVRRSLIAYATYLDATNEPESIDGFVRFTTARYIADPNVQQKYRERIAQEQAEREAKLREEAAAQARAEAEAEARQREAERLREAAERHATRHPVGQVAGQVRTGAEGTTGREPEPDYTKMSPAQIRQHTLRRLAAAAR